MNELLTEVVKRANRYLSGLPERGVSPAAEAVAKLKHFDVPLQDNPMDSAAVLAELDDLGSGATIASAGRRCLRVVGRRGTP